jgi:hypothetical protein
VVAIGAAAMTPPIAAFFIFQKLIFGRHLFLSFLLFFLVIIFLSSATSMSPAGKGDS